MKKKLRITVAGNTYEVEVEEIGIEKSAGSEVKPAASSPVMPQETVHANPKQPAAAPTAPAAQVGEGEKINAPIPGKVLSIKVKPGDMVKAGDVVLILEAMKMENEIGSPVDGTVKQVVVKEGQSVNTGDVMIVIG